MSRWLACCVLLGLLPLSGCRYVNRMSSVFASPPPGPRQPEAEMVDRMLDAIGYREDGAGREVAQIMEAPLHQRLRDLFALPREWIRLTGKLENGVTGWTAPSETLDTGDLGTPRPERVEARRARWRRQVDAAAPASRVGALSDLVAHSEEADFARLQARLRDPHPAVRAEAARAAARLGATRAAPVLRALLEEEPDPLARRAQLEALVAIAPVDGRARARRLARVDASPWVRERACELLARAPDAAAVEVLVERLLGDSDAMVRDAAAELLSGLTGIDVGVPSETGEAPPDAVVRRLRAWRPRRVEAPRDGTEK